MIITLSGPAQHSTRKIAISRAVNSVLSGYNLPLSRSAFGQTTSQDAIHEAINKALSRRRMIVTPTDPENAWRISNEFFQKLTAEVVDTTRSQGFIISSSEAAEALTNRGYIPSAPPPTFMRRELVRTPAPPAPTVVVSPVPVEAPVRTVVIQPSPEPVYEILPVPQQPPPQIQPSLPPEPPPVVVEAPTAPEDADNTALWIIAAIAGGIALGTMTKPRGGQNGRSA